MKKHCLSLILLVAISATSTAKESKSILNPDALAQCQENPKEHLVNWNNQQLIGFELTDSKASVEATLSLIFFTPKGQWQTFTSKPFKLVPGSTAFPGTILFPGIILEKLPKGKGLILFDLQINNFEALSLLRKLPARIPVVFNN